VENKKTLWVFGDSFSASLAHKLNRSWSTDYIRYLGYHPSIFPELISRDLDLYLKNVSEPGIGNESILDLISLNLKNIKQGDLVIIGWSSPTRWRFVEDDNWKVVGAFETQTDILDTKTMNEVSQNRLHGLYEEELFHRAEIVNKALGYPNSYIYQWTWYPIQPYKLIHRIRGERIKDETKGELEDNHFSKNSHKIMSRRIIEDYERWMSINEPNPL
jgi:hypothetical protein